MSYEVDLVFEGDHYEEGQRILEWTKKNCPTYITNQGVIYLSGALITFYFVKESEAMWFRLKYAERVYEE